MEWEHGREVQSGAYTLNDYDFEKPSVSSSSTAAPALASPVQGQGLRLSRKLLQDLGWRTVRAHAPRGVAVPMGACVRRDERARRRGGSGANADAISFRGEERIRAALDPRREEPGLSRSRTTIPLRGHDRTKTDRSRRDTHVKHNRTETVGNNGAIGIGVNRTGTVGSNESISVAKVLRIEGTMNDRFELPPMEPTEEAAAKDEFDQLRRRRLKRAKQLPPVSASTAY